MVRITFYADEACLGTYNCPHGSSQEERNTIARKHGINHYTKFILDDGRVTGWVEDGQLMHFEYGEDGINQPNTNTMDEQNNVSQDNCARSAGGAKDPIPQEAGRNLLNPAYFAGHDPIDAPTPRRNKLREIKINRADNGYIVTVGCQTLVFENMDTLIEKLTAYLKDPNTVEKRWMTEGIL
jgi:hypothetical protein